MANISFEALEICICSYSAEEGGPKKNKGSWRCFIDWEGDRDRARAWPGQRQLAWLFVYTRQSGGPDDASVSAAPLFLENFQQNTLRFHFTTISLAALSSGGSFKRFPRLECRLWQRFSSSLFNAEKY